MTDDRTHPADSESGQGGDKDTQSLKNIQGVQDQGMLEKGRQADETPQDVTGELDGSQPINQRR